MKKVVKVIVLILVRDQSVKVLPLWVHKDQGDASVKVLPLFTAHMDTKVKVRVLYLKRDMIVGLLVGTSVGRAGKQSSKIMSRFISN